MRKIFLFINCFFIMMSGCGNQKKQDEYKNNIQGISENINDDLDNKDFESSDIIYFLDFEQNLYNHKEDTFIINSIAKNITFIPLETSDDVLLYYDKIQIAKINDCYYISSSNYFSAFHSIMLFDSTGHFMNYLIQKGNGPNELPYISEWSYNRNTQLIVSSTYFQFFLNKLENNETNKFTFDHFTTGVCLLNDGTILGLPNVGKKGETDTPYLHFINQEGKIIHSFFYPKKRNIAFDIPEGRIVGHSEVYNLFPCFSGDALFKDMFNDTIYRIRSKDDVKPYIILYKGSLTPTILDVNNPSTGTQKIRLVQILDTKKYFFIRFTYRNEIYNSIWDKQSLTLIANTKLPQKLSSLYFNSIIKYRTFTGKEIFIQISSYFDGKLYGAIDAEQAMEFLPGINEFDNPVLIIIDIG